MHTITRESIIQQSINNCYTTIWVIIKQYSPISVTVFTRPYAIKCDIAVTVVLIIYLHIKAHT